MELLLSSIILFGGGYAYRFYTEPKVECKSIKFDYPKYLTKREHAQTDCFEGFDAGQINICKIPYPRAIVNLKEYESGVQECNQLRVYLRSCVNTIDKYNKNKEILK